MSSQLMLRYRDLVTEPGGTLREHRLLIKQFGYVWWGWWMRQYERVPRELFASLIEATRRGAFVTAYLFDSGSGLLHSCSIGDLRVAPGDAGLGAPEVQKAPYYYSRGRYPAWFRLHSIRDEQWEAGRLRLSAFPTQSQPSGSGPHPGEAVDSPADLREIDATLWLVHDARAEGA